MSAFPCTFILVLLLLNRGDPKSSYWGKSAKSELTFCSGLAQGSDLGSGSGWGWAAEQLQVSQLEGLIKVSPMTPAHSRGPPCPGSFTTAERAGPMRNEGVCVPPSVTAASVLMRSIL